MSDKELSGSCLCGAVTYTATGEPLRFYHCHCTRCRKASGTGHATNLFVKGSLAWQRGEDQVTIYKVPDAKRFATSFCRSCGSRVPRFIEKIGMVFIPAGSLDDDPGIGVQARIFTGSRAAWSCGASALQEFDEFPD